MGVKPKALPQRQVLPPSTPAYLKPLAAQWAVQVCQVRLGRVMAGAVRSCWMIVFVPPKRLGTGMLWKLTKKPRYMAPLTEYALGACGFRPERIGATAPNGAAKPGTGAIPWRGASTEPIEPKGLVRGVTGRGPAPRRGTPPPKSCGRAATPERSDTHAAVACMVASASGQSNLLYWKGNE